MKQAVVIIHGIGEQKPMDTLRGFVEAVLPSAEPGDEKYWSKPDLMSELFELRKLQSRTRPSTHFYEYYWAYRVEGTKILHLVLWLASLLLRRPRRVPKQLRLIWGISWILSVLAIVFASRGLLGSLTDVLGKSSSWNWISLILAALVSLIQYLMIYYLGDAARYLSPHPKNIALRQAIRSNGIKLLRRLHESGEYERIVIAGHSLGSVIAYDILTHLWEEYNTIHKKLARQEQVALRAVEKAGITLQQSWNQDAVEKFQELQHQLWLEQRSLDNPWLVTDLITMGSPLAHAAMLLANDEMDLAARQRQRELPTCPPAPDRNKYSFPKQPPYLVNGQKISLFVLHHAAHFACTRWTNLYFPAGGGLFGDLIGGPLHGVFGNGIKDVRVRSRRWRGLARLTPLIHTCYWMQETAESLSPMNGSVLSIVALRTALDLTARRSLRGGRRPATGQTQQDTRKPAEEYGPAENFPEPEDEDSL